MISEEDFKSVCHYSKGSGHIDLSVINSNLINPILQGIISFGSQLFEVLTISCHELAQLDENDFYPKYVVESIAINVPHYFKYFIKALASLLISSHKIKELHIIE